MQKYPFDVEEMLKVLKNHYSNVQMVTMTVLAQEKQEQTADKLIHYSNRELNKLNDELKKLKFDSEDLRYDLYKFITDILKDNITLRLRVNDMTQYYLKYNR